MVRMDNKILKLWVFFPIVEVWFTHNATNLSWVCKPKWHVTQTLKVNLNMTIMSSRPLHVARQWTAKKEFPASLVGTKTSQHRNVNQVDIHGSKTSVFKTSSLLNDSVKHPHCAPTIEVYQPYWSFLMCIQTLHQISLAHVLLHFSEKKEK